VEAKSRTSQLSDLSESMKA